jgi:hypothetical protein
VTDSSAKHLVVDCSDGWVLLTYTGLGLVRGGKHVSQWAREVLRGQVRTVDQTLVDFSEQAIAKIGRDAKQLGVKHVFLVGAFVQGEPRAALITNVPESPVRPDDVERTFRIVRVAQPVVLVGGSGQDTLSDGDRTMLANIAGRRPRDPVSYMKLLGDVNRRAAQQQPERTRSVSLSCTVVFVPPEGVPVKHEWYGPANERPDNPSVFSHIAGGIDLDEIVQPMMDSIGELQAGTLTHEAYSQRVSEGARRAHTAQGHRKT